MYPWMYVVLLGLVLIVYARLLPKSETAAPRNSVVQEIEETIEHFAVEMDEQNKAILDLFARTKQDYEVELAKLSGRMESMEKQKSELSQELSKIQMSNQAGAMSMAASRSASVSDMSIDSGAVADSTSPAPKKRSKAADKFEVPEVYIDEAPPLSLNMKSRYAELFSLHDQGKGVEAIAKKLGMNKGEVNLIIQLSQQEERSRV
jgi:hypothetical protein